MPSVTAVADTYSMSHDQTLTVDTAGDGLLGNDIGSSLHISVVNGETYYGGTQAFTLASGAIVTVHDDGTFEFQAAADTVYTETFDYTVTDDTESDDATASIDVTNAGPTAYDFSLNTRPNQALTALAIADFAFDPDDDPLTLNIVSDPTHGDLTDNEDGTWTYTPDENYKGTDSFTYKVNDGFADSATKTVTINVNNTNPVIGSALNYTVLTDHSISLQFLAVNATDADFDGLTAVIDDEPTTGTIITEWYGLIYTAGSTSGSDSFTYHVTDGYGNSSTITVNITVVESGLVVNNVIAKTENYHEIAIPTGNILTNVMGGTSYYTIQGENSDPDYTQPAHGTVTRGGEGEFIYLPDDGYTGADSFTVSVFDGVSYANVTVLVQVQPGPLLDWANATPGLPYFQDGFGAGRRYSVRLRGGQPITVWRPNAGVPADSQYWCHGFTFGGSAAANGPFSIWGNDVDSILLRGYVPVTQANAQAGDIVVFRTGATVDHSAVLTNVGLTGANFNTATTRLDSKNGSFAFANQTLAQLNTLYPDRTITVYRLR